MSARYYVGDALTVLRTMPDASVDLIMSSPPFLALRSYLPADHADKAHEIGSESTPGEFLDVLLDVVVECRRVLAPHGSLVFELGDTYAASAPTSGRTRAARVTPDLRRAGAAAEYAREGEVPIGGGKGWPLDKSKVLIPELFAVALSYGFNPLTGRTLEPWRVRNVVAWCRPNPPVGALGDKFRPATSFLTVACMGRDRYFDLDAVRTKDGPGGNVTRRSSLNRSAPGEHTQEERDLVVLDNPAGAPPLDYWVIPTHAFRGAHYATFPPDLCIRPVKAMCPERVCRSCGAPSRRIVGDASYVDSTTGKEHDGITWSSGIAGGRGAHTHKQDGSKIRQAPTLGWSDCGCSTDGSHWRAGLVLDPFAGSGTTLMVATGHGRDAIGIDLDPRNLELARERLGLFLEEAA